MSGAGVKDTSSLMAVVLVGDLGLRLQKARPGIPKSLTQAEGFVCADFNAFHRQVEI